MNSQGEREDDSTPAERSAPDSGEVGVGDLTLEANHVAPDRDVDKPVIYTRPIPASSSKIFRPLERDATFSHGRLLVPAHPTLDLGHIRKGRFDLPHSQNSYNNNLMNVLNFCHTEQIIAPSESSPTTSWRNAMHSLH
jgi:hypothetical protein